MTQSKKVAKLLSFIFFLSLLISVPTQSFAKKWEVDKAHSNIYFSVGHIFSQVQGHFNDFSVDVMFDPDSLETSKFVFEIETASIDTNIAKRDKHLQSGDFFDAKKFPQMVFTSEKIVDAGNGAYALHGKLVVKGITYDLVLPLNLAGVKDHPAAKGKEVAGFNGKVMLDRLSYNIGGGKFYEMGVVGKDVEVFVSLELMASK